MRTTESCPSPADVERMYWSTLGGQPSEADLDLHTHISTCPSCTAQCREIADLAALGGRLEPSAWTRREEIRTTLLSNVQPAAQIAARGARWPWLVPALLAAAAVVVVVAWRSSSTGDPVGAPHDARAIILDHGTTRHLLVSSAPDEIVRLVDGSMTITVGPLDRTERFRVVTSDGEVEAADAAFDITAVNDRLVSVRAIRGVATVKVASFERRLQPGETWRDTGELAGIADRPLAPVDAAVVAVVSSAPPEAVPAPIPTETPVAPPRPRPVRPAAAEPLPSPAPSPAEGVSATDMTPAPSPAPAPAPRSMVQQAFDEGWAALRAGEFATAATAFERASVVTADPRMIEDAAYWRGVALARAGDVGAARHVFTAFLAAYASSPRGPEVSAMLGWILFERGDLAEAKRRFEAALASSSREVRDSANAGLRAVTTSRSAATR